MGSKIRYVQPVPKCPRCGKPGSLYVEYSPNRSGWVPHFRVRHRKSRYNRSRYRLFRRHGYTPDEASEYSGCSRLVELPGCRFGRKYPAPILNKIRGPNETKRREPSRRHRIKMPRRPLDRSWSPNKDRVFLTQAEADEIRRKYASRQMTETQLAEKYRVAQSQISFIVNGKILS